MKPEGIPGHVTLSDGVPRKLYFLGERYVCAKRSARHTYLDGCAEGLLQENAEEPNNDRRLPRKNNNRSQTNNRKRKTL